MFSVASLVPVTVLRAGRLRPAALSYDIWGRGYRQRVPIMEAVWPGSSALVV